MAKEPFLINPPKRLKIKRKPRRSIWRPPSRGLLGAEKSRHRPTAYSFKGHWFTSAGARVAKPGLRLNPFRRRRRIRNPFGEEAMLVGVNPGRSFKMRRRRSRRRHNRVRSRRRHNPMFFKRYRRHRSRRHNPVRRHRRYRRNPISISGITSQATSMLPMVAGGIGGMIAVRTLPKMIGLSGIPFYGGQLAVIIGGNMALKKLSSKAAEGFMVVGATTMAYDIVKGLLGSTFSYLGLDDDEEYAAYPEGMGEEEFSAYPEGLGEDEDDLSGFGSYHDMSDFGADFGAPFRRPIRRPLPPYRFGDVNGYGITAAQRQRIMKRAVGTR